MQKILILGIDGYIGWPLAMHLSASGHIVAGIDNFDRRKNVEEIGSHSAIPILDIMERIRKHGSKIGFMGGSVTHYSLLREWIKTFMPDTIIHLAEQPSAPYSMIDVDHAVYTQHNNVMGTLNVLFAMREFAPDCHLLKLGTMGEYGTPNLEIPEDPIEIEFRGRKDTVQFPRKPGSLYHLSKVHDTNNIEFACRVWELRSTDIMQGVVYGTKTMDMRHDVGLFTRFDFDEYFGTAINRFCAQAVIGHPLTPYGNGGQTRGFIALEDSVQCLTLAAENPPEKGEYRVFNQLDETYSVNDLAKHIKRAAEAHGLRPEIENIENPRVEKEEHFYKVDVNKLRKLGFRPTSTLRDELDFMITDLLQHQDRIYEKRHVIMPKTYWRKRKAEDEVKVKR